MSIQYKCASCGNTVQTPDDSAGKMGRCPHCAHIMQIPPAQAASGGARAVPNVPPAKSQPGNPFADPQPQYASSQYAQPPYGHGQTSYAPGHPAGGPPPGYGPGGYGAYGYDGEIWSHRSKIAAGLLGIFVGGWGVHRFYLGFVGIGILQIFVSLVTCGLGGLWGFIEGILYLTGTMDRDVDGRKLRD